MVGLLLLAASCSSASTDTPVAEPTGPPVVQQDVVDRHAQQFDDDLSVRVAGSQEEFAASAYLLGHLQRAGYVVRLEPVPVGDLVRSTDVIAVRPGDEAPSTVVAVAYDSPSPVEPSGESLGLFLELARALAVASPQHSTWFVALGAQGAPTDGGNLGSKILGKVLREEDLDPLVMMINPSFGAASVAGSGAHELSTWGADHGMDAADSSRLSEKAIDEGSVILFGRSDVDYVWVSGSTSKVGPLLLGFLEDRES